MIICIFLAIPIARSQSADAALEVATEPFLIPQQSAPRNSPIPPATAGSGDQTSPAQNTTAEDEQRKKAQVQLEQEEHQRVFGVMATFNTTRNMEALSLTSGQKYQLFFKSATDPWPFVVAAFGAGIDQADVPATINLSNTMVYSDSPSENQRKTRAQEGHSCTESAIRFPSFYRIESGP